MFCSMINHHTFVLLNVKKSKFMKTSIKNSLVIIAMLGVVTGYANLTPINASYGEDPKRTILTLESMREGQRLFIKSTNGTILYKESIDRSGSYKKEFDLTSLPNGDYFFEVDKDFEIKIIPFKVNGAQVTFQKERTKSIFKPVVTIKDNIVTVSKLVLDNTSVDVKIYFDSGDYELIHSERIENIKNIQRVYRLLKNVTGNYKVICKSDGREFVTYFKV